MTNTKWIACLAVAVACNLPLLGVGQDDVLIPADQVEFRVKPLVELAVPIFDVAFNLDDEKTEKADSGSTEYWLGVQVAVGPAIAKRQLAIDHGLAVEEVAPDSPAAKAEIKKFDILIQAGDTPLKGVGDLIK